MGLDITAYRGLKKVDAVFNAEGDPIDPETMEYRDDVTRFYISPHFIGREGALEDGACYTFSDSMGMSAGSYGWYNGWREQLAKMAGYPAINYHGHPSHTASAWQADSGPFWELINFSDCQGVIGAEVSAKLAADFASYQEAADMVDQPYFAAKYREWREAFEMAADNGAVDFH